MKICSIICHLDGNAEQLHDVFGDDRRLAFASTDQS